MKKSRMVRMVGVAVLAAAAATLGFSGTATAQVEDVQVLIDNLPAAAEDLADGLQEAAAVAQETQSAVETSAAVGDALVSAGTILVQGSEQFGALGLGLLLTNLAVQQGLAPYLGAIDDPSTAGDLFNPDDLSTLLNNVGPAAEFTTDNLTTALIEGLQGNLVAPGFVDPVTGTPSLLGNVVAIGGDLFTGGVAIVLTDGTNFQGLATIVPIAILVGGAAAGGIVGEYLQQVEDGAAPVFEAAEPVTGPVIQALQGV